MDLYISNDLAQCENFQSFCQKFEILKNLENFKFQLGSIFMNEFSRQNAESENAIASQLFLNI